MSRHGNCWDNPLQGSFFGHLKNEIVINSYETFEYLVKNKLLSRLL